MHRPLSSMVGQEVQNQKFGLTGFDAGPALGAAVRQWRFIHEISSIAFPLTRAFGGASKAELRRALRLCRGRSLLCSHLPPEHFANELFQGENALARNAGLIFLINIPLEECKIFLVFVNIFTLPAAMSRALT